MMTDTNNKHPRYSIFYILLTLSPFQVHVFCSTLLSISLQLHSV